MRRVGLMVGVCSVAVGLLCLTQSVCPSQAEMYVAGQFGVTFPNNATNLEGVDSKVGYYFDSVKWLGVETEVFNTTPNIKQQDATVSGFGVSGTATFRGQDLRVLNWSPITVVVRYQAGQFEPYAGVGMGVYFHVFTMVRVENLPLTRAWA